MGEETKNPSVNAPKGIINSVVISCISTFIFLLVTLYNIGGESDHYLNQLVNSQNLYFDIFKK
jgi:amino acid transporter